MRERDRVAGGGKNYCITSSSSPLLTSFHCTVSQKKTLLLLCLCQCFLTARKETKTEEGRRERCKAGKSKRLSLMFEIPMLMV